mgnify:CR=1 FL=1
MGSRRRHKEFYAEKYYENEIKNLKDRNDDREFRWRFEIDTKEGVHIGGVIILI